MRKKTNPIVAAIQGVVVALVIAYGVSYLLTRFGSGVVISPGEAGVRGPAVFARAGLNLCAMHGVPLVGTGGSGVQHVAARVVLPLTVWAIVPILSLLIGGWVAGRSRVGAKRWSVIAPAVLTGVIYAAILAAASRFFTAKLDASVLPTFDGTGFNPPDILFSPAASAFYYLAGYGVIFGYLGALTALRGRRTNGNWWACGKAAIVMAVVIQLFIAAGLAAWIIHSEPYKTAGSCSNSRVFEMLPAASGMLYSVVYGATLRSGVEAQGPGAEGMYNMPFAAKVNLYSGVSQSVEAKAPAKPLSGWVYWILLIPAIGMFFSGVLAARWGSRDGSVPTSLRIIIVHSVYLAILITLCRVGWGAEQSAGQISSGFKLFIAPSYTRMMLLTSVAGLVLSFIGAQLAHRRSS